MIRHRLSVNLQLHTMATNKKPTTTVRVKPNELTEEEVKCVFMSCTEKVKIRDLSKHLTVTQFGRKKHISSYRGTEARDLIIKLSDYVVQLESEQNQVLQTSSSTPNDAKPRDVMTMMFQHKQDLEQKLTECHTAVMEELQSIETAVDEWKKSSFFQKLGITSTEKPAQQRQKKTEVVEQQQSSQQLQIMALEETKKELETENAALKSQLQGLEDAGKEIKRLKEQLNKIQRRRYGHQVIGGMEHGHLSAAYNSLFSNDWQKAYDFLTTVQKMDKMLARWLIGAMFENSYKAYKEHIFSTLFDDIFTPNSSFEHRDMKALKAKADTYGDLIQHCSENAAVGLNNPSLVQSMVLQKYLPKYKAVLIAGGTETPAMTFLRKAIELSWQMLTIHPPMIVSTPAGFDDDIHERHPSHWDDELEEQGNFRLLYFRPVLYTSYEEIKPEKKGQVGTYPEQTQ